MKPRKLIAPLTIFFIGAGIAVGGGILIDRGIDTLKQDLILDKDKMCIRDRKNTNTKRAALPYP